MKLHRIVLVFMAVTLILYPDLFNNANADDAFSNTAVPAQSPKVQAGINSSPSNQITSYEKSINDNLTETVEEFPAIDTIIPGFNAIVGGEQIYIVKKGETIRLIGAKLGVNWRQLAQYNGINPDRPLLREGIELVYNNRRIVPKTISDGLLINIPDRTLYYFRGGELAEMSSVTVGQPDKKWRTPTGSFRIICKSKNPTWTVPPSIQQEMLEKGKEVLKVVPPGKDNPLGKYSLKTSMGNIMLHSTNNPSSIYGFKSHGCIRVYPENMEKIFYSVSLSTKGEIIYMPVKIAITTDWHIFMEINPDAYGKVGDLEKEARRIAGLYNISNQIDWDKVSFLLQDKSGIAEDVTLEPVDIADSTDQNGFGNRTSVN